MLDQLVSEFNSRAGSVYNTELVGGADEPLYLPAEGNKGRHRIYFRENFLSSALHELAHWCLAGEARRQRVDYGYWYNPDGRDEVEQLAFEQVEVKPQALEWIFSLALGHTFHFSADNLNSNSGVSESFKACVQAQRDIWLNEGLPVRANKVKELCEGVRACSYI